MATQSSSDSKELLVQIATYNANLQGNAGLPQDLVDWLAPTSKVSSFLSHERRAPDIVAVGFQELLPLHLGLAGFTHKVFQARDELVRSQIEAHAPNGERYTLVARVVNVGVALLVYVRDEHLSQRVRDVQTQWTGCGPGWIGNKGAVGVRFRLNAAESGAVGETFTFVCAHLTAHAGKLEHRIGDYHHIVGTLLFPPHVSSPKGTSRTTIYDTSHLFVLGDLNFRLALPKELSGSDNRDRILDMLVHESSREELKEYDELFQERKKGNVFLGLREGDFWSFKCTYKYRLKAVDRYSIKRTPAWTDRILYTSYLDSPDSPQTSCIKPILYTSIPSYTASDHKPIVALLSVPTRVLSSSEVPPKTTTPINGRSSSESSSSPLLPKSSSQVSNYTALPTLQLPSHYTPRPHSCWRLKRHVGHLLGRIVGAIWSLLVIVGLGSSVLGVFNAVVLGYAFRWWSGVGYGYDNLSNGSTDSTESLLESGAASHN